MEYVMEQREFEKDGFIYTIKHILDEQPDLSYLGEFSNTWEKGAIEHSNDSRMSRYFIPANPEYGQQDYEHMMDYERDHWWMIGIVAEIYFKDKAYPIARSGGLWGVQSDSERSYFAEIEEEQIAEAEAELSGIREELIRRG